MSITNFARFYALLNRLPTSDREELKKQLVYTYTHGRTDSLRDMRIDEYNALIRDLERQTGNDERREAFRQDLKRKRSVCLKLMQQIGLDTTDWAVIDNFCMHPRIVGKQFRRIDPEELEELSVKLRSILRKGGLKPKPMPPAQQPSVLYVPMHNLAEC